MHSISSLSRERSMTLALLAYLLDDPSVWILHWGHSPAPWPSMLVNSVMKSMTTCPFMAVRGWYCTSNLLNLIAHSAIRPAALGLLIALRRGLSIKTITVCALKYSFSLWAAVTKAKASFSIGGYLSSAPQSARLMKYTGFYTLSSSLSKAALTAVKKTAR